VHGGQDLPAASSRLNSIKNRASLPAIASLYFPDSSQGVFEEAEVGVIAEA
jgi:hypothetical protein